MQLMSRMIAASVLIVLATSLAFAAGEQEIAEATTGDVVYDVRWTMGFWGTEMDPDNLFASTINDQFPNLNLQTEFIPQKTLNQKYAVIIASGDMPEILLSQGKGAWIDWVKQGAFVALDDYIWDYPNIRANVKDDVLDRSARIDGKIYGMPVNWKDIDRVLAVREDWLDTLGLQPPTTVEELYEVAYQFTYGDPDGNGKNDTFGFPLHNEMNEANQLFGPAYDFMMGAKDEIHLQRNADGEIVLGFMQPGVADYMALLRRAWADGIIEPSSMTKNSNKDIFHNGTIGMYDLQPTSLQDTLETMHEVDPDARVVMLPPVSAEGYGRPVVQKGTGWFRIHQLTNVVEDPGEIRAILSMFDWLFGDGYDLLHLGIEGTTFVYDESGNPVQTTYFKDSGWNNMSSFLKRYGAEYLFSPFEYVTDAAQKGADIIEEYRQYVSQPPVILADKPEAQEFGADLQRIRLEGLFKIIVGDLPVSALDDIREEWLDRGGRLYLEQAKKLLGES